MWPGTTLRRDGNTSNTETSSWKLALFAWPLKIALLSLPAKAQTNSPTLFETIPKKLVFWKVRLWSALTTPFDLKRFIRYDALAVQWLGLPPSWSPKSFTGNSFATPHCYDFEPRTSSHVLASSQSYNRFQICIPKTVGHCLLASLASWLTSPWDDELPRSGVATPDTSQLQSRDGLEHFIWSFPRTS